MAFGCFHYAKMKQMQQSWLYNPDVAGLSKTLWLFSLSTTLQFLSRTASQPAHTLQAAVRWPQGSESHHKGVVYCIHACVCLSLRFYVGKSVSVFVLVEAGPWELRVGAS